MTKAIVFRIPTAVKLFCRSVKNGWHDNSLSTARSIYCRRPYRQKRRLRKLSVSEIQHSDCNCRERPLKRPWFEKWRWIYELEALVSLHFAFILRCFKTHFWYPSCPKGAKYIVIYREPCAASFSFFNFFKGWFFQPGEVSLHEFVRDFLLHDGVAKLKDEPTSYFAHLLSWWEHRNDPNVLFLFYEDMKDDLESVVRMVAEFIGIKDEEKIKKAVEMSSFKFMKENDSKFADKRLHRMRNKIVGVPEDTMSSKFGAGSATKGREVMDEETREMIQEKWREVVGKEIGFQDYNELREAFKTEKKNRIKNLDSWFFPLFLCLLAYFKFCNVICMSCLFLLSIKSTWLAYILTRAV